MEADPVDVWGRP